MCGICGIYNFGTLAPVDRVSLKRATEQQATLRLVVTSPQIEKILKITGLLGIFEIYSDPQSAVSHRP